MVCLQVEGLVEVLGGRSYIVVRKHGAAQASYQPLYGALRAINLTMYEIVGHILRDLSRLVAPEGLDVVGVGILPGITVLHPVQRHQSILHIQTWEVFGATLLAYKKKFIFVLTILYLKKKKTKKMYVVIAN